MATDAPTFRAFVGNISWATTEADLEAAKKNANNHNSGHNKGNSPESLWTQPAKRGQQKQMLATKL